jgi:hypothetical protein
MSREITRSIHVTEGFSKAVWDDSATTKACPTSQLSGKVTEVEAEAGAQNPSRHHKKNKKIFFIWTTFCSNQATSSFLH